MADPAPHYYWDTCVFIAHLNEDRAAYGPLIDDIKQFLSEAQSGKCFIYCSTITIAEITRANAAKSTHDSFLSFLDDFKSAVIPISPDPNVMALASELRSLTYVKTGGERKLLTPDAIHLASAVTLVDVYGVKLEAFHTFDSGKGRSIEGKGTPLLTFETWCGECKDDPIAQKVIGMDRCHPSHPNKGLGLG